MLYLFIDLFSSEILAILLSTINLVPDEVDANSKSNKVFDFDLNTTRILQGFAFLCNLGLLLFKPHWDCHDYKI